MTNARVDNENTKSTKNNRRKTPKGGGLDTNALMAQLDDAKEELDSFSKKQKPTGKKSPATD